MKWIITAQYNAAGTPQRYVAIGARDALMDAAYDAGALGVTAVELP